MVKKIIIICGIAILVIVGLIINYFQNKNNTPKVITPNDNNEVTTYDITVQIIGEVNKPGIYEVSTDSRVYDLVLLAGGFTSNADTSLNLVQKLKDGMIVIVEARKDTKVPTKVSINKATYEELNALPNVGPSLANEILAYRERVGGFNSLNDLEQVKGVSEKILISILPYISL